MQQPLFSKTVFFCLLMFVCLKAHAEFTQDSLTTIKKDSASVSDSLPKKVVDIILVGNVLTKPQIILRELTFHKGNSIKPSAFEKLFVRSEDNLMNTSLFNSAHITWLVNDSNSVTVYVILKERWYIFPFPIFELVDRNFNEWLRSKDFTKINYGGVVTWNNFRGRNETIGMTLRFGYTQRVSFFYSIPFISKGQRAGLNFAFAFSRNHETSYTSYNNDLVYYKDEKNFARKDVSGSIQYTYRKGLYQTHVLDAGYRHETVEDTVVRLNADFFSKGQASEKYFTLRYIYKIEHRDLVAYPLHGSYFDAEVSKVGFPLFRDDISFSYLTSTYKRYWQLSKKFYFASSVSGKLSDSNPQPFFNIGGLGFGSNYLRGYEYYVLLGKKYGLLKTNFKFELLPTHTIHTSLIPLQKFSTIPYAFYINVYGDGGYVEDHQYSKYNSLTNSFQYSFGGGIDFVTYYDLVFRLEYSVNKFGESGIFLHFSAPI